MQLRVAIFHLVLAYFFTKCFTFYGLSQVVESWQKINASVLTKTNHGTSILALSVIYIGMHIKICLGKAASSTNPCLECLAWVKALELCH